MGESTRNNVSQRYERKGERHMKTSSLTKTIGFRLLSIITIFIGVEIGSLLVDLFLKFPMRYFPYLNDPKQFYWLALIPAIIVMLSIVSMFYLSIKDDLNFYSSKQFTIKRLVGSIMTGLMIAFIVRSLVLAVSWLLHASGY